MSTKLLLTACTAALLTTCHAQVAITSPRTQPVYPVANTLTPVNNTTTPAPPSHTLNTQLLDNTLQSTGIQINTSDSRQYIFSNTNYPNITTSTSIVPAIPASLLYRTTFTALNVTGAALDALLHNNGLNYIGTSTNATTTVMSISEVFTTSTSQYGQLLTYTHNNNLTVTAIHNHYTMDVSPSVTFCHITGIGEQTAVANTIALLLTLITRVYVINYGGIGPVILPTPDSTSNTNTTTTSSAAPRDFGPLLSPASGGVNVNNSSIVTITNNSTLTPAAYKLDRLPPSTKADVHAHRYKLTSELCVILPQAPAAITQTDVGNINAVLGINTVGNWTNSSASYYTVAVPQPVRFLSSNGTQTSSLNITLRAEHGAQSLASFVGSGDSGGVFGQIAVADQTKLTPVLAALQQVNIVPSAIVTHYILTTPQLLFVHYSGTGNLIELATGVGLALNVIGANVTYGLSQATSPGVSSQGNYTTGYVRSNSTVPFTTINATLNN